MHSDTPGAATLAAAVRRALSAADVDVGLVRPMTDAADVRLLPCGPRAVLAEYGSLPEVMRRTDHLHRRIDGGDLLGVIEVVPAARTVLVEVHAGTSLDRRHAALTESLGTEASGPVVSPDVAVPVVEIDGATTTAPTCTRWPTDVG